MKKTLGIILSLILLGNFLSTTYASAASFNIDFETSCDSISLMNLDTDSIVYEKNPDKRRSPASITKIMTYIIVTQNVKDLEGTKVTATKDTIDELLGTDSSVANIKAGDEFSVYQLLHGMMIASGNDAALILANYIGGGDTSKFVNMMNEKAHELGCENTHFVNPHGLYDPNHYTTTNDMLKITKYALTMPYFSEITNKTVSYILGDDWPLVTTNRLIDPINGGSYYYRYAKGIKTGHLDEAGYCLASSAVRGGYTYLCIAMGAPINSESDNDINGAMIDSKTLYMWAFKNLEIKTVLSQEQPIGETNLKYAYKKDKLMLQPAKDLSAILPVDVDVSSVQIVKDYPEEVETPIHEGDKIGTATVYYANNPISTIDVVSGETVQRNQLIYAIALLNTIVTSKIFIAIAIILILLFATYAFLVVMQNKQNKEKMRKYKK